MVFSSDANIDDKRAFIVNGPGLMTHNLCIFVPLTLKHRELIPSHSCYKETWDSVCLASTRVLDLEKSLLQF